MCKLRVAGGDADGLLADYGRMLAAAEAGTVSRAAAEKKLSSLLDHLALAAPGRPHVPPALLERVFAATLAAPAAPDRLKFRTRLRLAHLWLDAGDHARADAALRELRSACAAHDASGGTALLDVLAAQIKLHTATGDGRRLKDAHRAALAVVKAAIPHPRVLGTVRACGGALALADGAFADAASDFFDAFKSYDEAGDAHRALCLKHAVLASMLAGTGVDPLDAQEARPLKSDPTVAPMVELAAAFGDGDVKAFEKTLTRHRAAFEGDPVVAANVGDLRATVRARRARRLLAPYSRVRLASVAEGLGVSEADAEALVAGLIRDGALDAAVDQVAGTVEVGGEGAGGGVVGGPGAGAEHGDGGAAAGGVERERENREGEREGAWLLAGGVCVCVFRRGVDFF
jgi:COP9 signalosome complex subunit 2